MCWIHLLDVLILQNYLPINSVVYSASVALISAMCYVVADTQFSGYGI